MRRNQKYRFLLNDNPGHFEVHDLDNEQTGAQECQIDKILISGNARYLTGTALSDLISWLKEHPEYDGCKYCLAAYHWK